MITRLKEQMSLNADMTNPEIEMRFAQIAKLLFESFAIQKGEKIYLFKEIEFYFYNKHHRDIITYPRICDTICWYVNRFGGIDLNFPSFTRKKVVSVVNGKEVERYILDDKSYFGGILIRQLVSEDRTETLSGPLACATLFNGHVDMKNDLETPVLIEHENKVVSFYVHSRRNILPRGISVEKKVASILGNFCEHPSSEELHDEFLYFKDKQYSYVLRDFLMHDSETNEVYFSPWLNDEKEGHSQFYLRLKNVLNDCGIELKELKCTNDYWVRDYMPVQLGKKEFVRYRYWPDYLMRNGNPKNVELRTDCTKVLRGMGLVCHPTDEIIDGGNMVSCGPYIVMTDKVFTENGHEIGDTEYKDFLESELGHPVIIIPWQKHGEDVFGHSDGFIKWCGGNRILMGNHGDEYPEEAVTIRRILEGYGFEVTEMRFADKVDLPHTDLNWAYINFLQVGNKIIMPIFNIKEDAIAWQYIHEAFPNCEIHQIEMTEIVEEGGALHCISWNIRK